MANRTASPPSLPPDAIEAITSKPADAPRRCFICLTDEAPDDPPNSWVDPCPCTLEAHQDCILSWVTDCERSNKPLRCPVCKSDIEMEGQWDPIVALHDYIVGRFTKGSPWFLVTGATLGVTSGLQMYGAMSIAAFAGREALLQLMLGNERTVDVTKPAGFSGERLRNGLMLMQIAPALLVHRVTPSLVDYLFSPQVFLYGVYHFKTDPNFVRWPPSPELALTAFPIIRRAYYSLYKEFIMPREVRLNRIMAGLPPEEPRRNQGQNRNGQRNGEGGVIGFLQNVIDALDPDDERPEGQRRGIEIVQEEGPPPEEGQEGDVVVDVELVIEEAPEEDPVEEGEGRLEMDEANDNPDPEAPQIPDNNRPEEDEAPEGQDEDQEVHNHEAPRAPPARPGLGAILHSVSNSIVSALTLPGVCFAVGEALRITLPASRQNGLLKQQWGRSLVGGCLYVVMKDVVRLYAKHRKVQALANRKVKNVDRARRNQGKGGELS